METTLYWLRPRINPDNGTTLYRPTVNNLELMKGHEFRSWQDRDKNGDPIPGVPQRLVVILGERFGRLLSRGFHTLDIVDPDGDLQLDMINKVAMNGAYVIPDGQKKPVLTFDGSDEHCYVIMGFGLVPVAVTLPDPVSRKMRTTLWTDPDILEFARRGIVFESHGFHGLGGTNSVLASEAGLPPVGAEAKTMWSSISHHRVSGTRIAQYGYHLVQVNKHGGEGMFRDADGTKARIVGTPKGLQLVDADAAAYDKFWNLSEERRMQEAAARREARRLQKAAADEEEKQPEATSVD